jgi:RNA polymerase sigma factor (sigma-70 family)
MTPASGSSLLPVIRRLAQPRDLAGATDGQLLKWFISWRHDAVFRALVDRHGPMVMSVCRRVLESEHDAEDALQATFLILARKAAAVRPRDCVANWLHGVAYRTAQKARVSRARAAAARRRAAERLATMSDYTPADDDVWRDLQPVLDQELQRLPDTYRAAVVLCDLEGKSRKDAARQLGWPEGTLSGRLARARKRLADRLARRGVTLSAAALAAVLTRGAASAAVPVALKSTLTRAAVLWAGGSALPAGVVSAPVVQLTEGTMKTLPLARLWVGLVCAAAVGLAAAGAGLVAAQVGAARPQAAAAANPPAPAADTPKPADAELHVVGVYGPKDEGVVTVEVRPTARPVVLVLTAYLETEWRVKLAAGARLKQVIVSGYFAQEIRGVPAGVPVANRSYDPPDGSRRRGGWFYEYQWDTPQCREMVRRLNAETGLPIASFQGEYQGGSFVVDGAKGREFGQKDLPPRRPAPKEPTPEEFRAASAGGELHVVSAADPRVPHYAVEVRATDKPVVLALTSSWQAVWTVKPAVGARIGAVVVSGSLPQEVDGLPAGVPVLHCCPDGSFFFGGGGRGRDVHAFHATNPNTLEYRRMLERLNDLTGLLVSTFQAESRGAAAFVVDGARGREFAQKERRPRWTPPKEPTPQDLLAACAGAELHGVGMYDARDGNGAPVVVEVRRTDKPVVLVLSSYFSVLWRVKVAAGAKLKAVIVGGWFEQEIEGVPAGVPVAYKVGQPGRKEDHFYAYAADTFGYRRMVDRLNDLTGLLVSTFQLEHTGTAFVIDGVSGRELVQKERKSRWVPPKEPAPEQLRAAAAGAGLHVVGLYQAGDRGSTVDVEVRPADKPIVLALTSYSEVRWNVKVAAGAKLKAVIVGGWFEQDLEGVPTDIPVVYRVGSGTGRKDYFYAYRANSIEFRRMVDRLNDLTGLLVSTAQMEYRASSVVVDGARGRELAQKERKPLPQLPPAATPQQLRAAAAGAELHHVGISEPGGGDGAPVEVEVRRTDKPVVLVVTAYYSTLWRVKVADGAKLKAVIVGGWFEQEIEGVPAGVPVAYKVGQPGRKEDHVYAYKANSLAYRRMAERLNELTGLPVSTTQIEAKGSSYVVDGTRGRDVAAQALDGGPRAPAPNQAKEEDPLADVADVPAQDLRAAGDADKRYFLIGPMKNSRPPASGYGLMVILPGGGGGPDFHPFVRRIAKNALPDRYLAAQPVAVKWIADQEIVWPTKTNPVEKMKFSTEEFVAAVIEDVAKKHKLDRSNVFTLSWSSSGPAAYATALHDKTGVRGSFVAMSVFNPRYLPPLAGAKGHAFYLYHSPQDRVCPYRMAEQAKTALAENGAKVRLETYAGGHGWRGDVYADIRTGVEWLEKNRAKADGP